MSEFKKAVLNVVKNIPVGKVASYGQVALLAGVPRAARAVGQVLCEYGHEVPWWRVINNAGQITTNCLDHTALMQKEYLQKEGIKVSEKLSVAIEKNRWLPNKKELKQLELEEKYVDQLLNKYF